MYLSIVKTRIKKTRPSKDEALYPWYHLCSDYPSRHNPSCAARLNWLVAVPDNGGGPVSSSLTLAGGFNVVSLLRLALSRLAVCLYRCLLVLFNAFLIDSLIAEMIYDSAFSVKRKEREGLPVLVLLNGSRLQWRAWEIPDRKMSLLMFCAELLDRSSLPCYTRDWKSFSGKEKSR